jgi:ATP-dependent helicase/nuclease subunit B
VLDEAGHAGRPHTFVVGLEEGRTLPAALEDPVLLDGERQSLSADLLTSADRVTEALHRVVSRLAALGGRVCLSYSCRDLREHRETFPSWLLLQAFRLLRKDATLTYQALVEALGEPVSPVPPAAGQALAESGWWLAHLNGVGPSALPAVHAAFPWLAQGEAAEAERDSDVFTASDGFVREAGRLLDPRTSGRPVAATTLEDFARCPFRHFLQRALGLDPIETAEPDRDRWLEPWQRGQVLHDLYAAILREVRAGGGRLDVEAHGRRLTALAEARLAETARLMPPPSDYVFQRERQQVLEDCLLFLDLEARERRAPVGFEVSFGSGLPEGEPLAQADPVTIDLGRGFVFRLRGRIDRVDRLRDGTYEVIDYKTGGYWPSDFTGTFQGGRLLQHALYALAATQLLRRIGGDARVSKSCYYLPTARGRGERVVCPPVSRDQVAAVLRDLFDVAAAGAFVHAQDESDCKWCDFGPACGPRPHARAAAKLANPVNQVLDAYRRLGRHA